MKSHISLVSYSLPLLLVWLAGSTCSVPLPHSQPPQPYRNELTLTPDQIQVLLPVTLDELTILDPALAERIYEGEVELELDPSYSYISQDEEATDGNEEEAEEEEEINGVEESENHENNGNEDEDEEGGVEHQRMKRQTSVSGSVNAENSRGGRRVQGSLNVDHTWRNRHTLSGNLGVDYTRSRGWPSQRSYSGGLSYTYRPNRRTSLSIGAQRNWGSSGRSNSFGLSFSRSFGR